MVVKDEDSDKTLELFLKIGLDERTARNTIANNKVTANLTAVIHEAALTNGCDRTIGNLLYTVATKYPANALVHRPNLLDYVVSSKIKTPAQLEAAFLFLSNVASDNFKRNEFEEACGVVGELLGTVRKKHPWADPKIAKQPVDAKMFELLGERTAADDEKPSRKKEKKEKPAKVESKAVVDDTPAQPSEEELNPFSIFPAPEDNIKVHTEVFFSNGSVLRCCNTREMLDKHLKVTGGRVFTRFPPEPNGYLHIGHAKVMFVNFGLAKEVWMLLPQVRISLLCYHLKYDDTNPEAEKKEYINHIEEIVQWMGWEPFKITYTSDYFQDLYELAVELIRRGHAYVDHQSLLSRKCSIYLTGTDDMKRGLIEEGKATLRMKQDMQSDNFNMYDLIAYRIKASVLLLTLMQEISGAFIRAMIILTASWTLLRISHIQIPLGNSTYLGLRWVGGRKLEIFGFMPTIRIRVKAPRAGQTLDYLLAHFKTLKEKPLTDTGQQMKMALQVGMESFEVMGWCRKGWGRKREHTWRGIGTYKLCTLEFETRRASYYWLLHVLDLYQPYVWEYSRLNVTNTVMSKRKLNYIVTNKYVDGWDDPRLMTLAGLRCRGVTSTAINAFVRGIGITRSDCSMIRLDRFEYHIREELNKTAPRALVVLHPLKVVITNLKSGAVMDLDTKKWPDAQADDTSAFYKVPFSNVVYIERSDFQMKDSKDYYGLAPDKSALLRYAFPIKCTKVIFADDNETVLEIRAEYDPSKKSKPKGVLQWVAEPSPAVDPLKVEVRLFYKLFNSENPAELDNWLADLNLDSKVEIPAAYAVSSLRDAAVGDTFQFERLGYFTVDKDSTEEKLVFNRTVTLKDTYGKGGK
ncbi:hypothetical protein CRYUN_Cryun21dG0083200 [Craigia yunnanensis]